MLAREMRHENLFQIARDSGVEFRALIVDRDAMGSGLMVDTLRRELKCEAIGAQSGDVLRVLAGKSIDVVIISADINAGAGSGFELANAVSSAYPEMPIVILLDRPGREMVIKAFHSGACGVFHRQQPISRFLDCIDHVRNRHIWAGEEETEVILETLKNIPTTGALTPANFGTLTPRELEVVGCASRGSTNKRIAKELGLSVHTVKNYLSRAFEKLGVSSRIQLLFYLTVRGQAEGRARGAHGSSAAN